MPPRAAKVVLTEDQLNEEVVKATLRESALKNTLNRKKEEVAKARREEQELRERFMQLEEAYLEAKKERFDIISDFTRQHKATADELIARTTILESTITDLKDQQELSKLALEETKKERDQYIAMKDKEFEEQDHKMKEMDEEFRVMLSDTQNKMTERVEATMKISEEGDEASPASATDAPPPASEPPEH